MTVISYNKDPNEYPLHRKMKFRVADLIDCYYTDLYYVPAGFLIYTYTEYKFSKIDTPRGKKEYKTDILVLGYPKDFPNILHIHLNIEIDLEKGHWSTWNRSKNKLRDEMLKEKFNVHVKRLNGYWLKKMTDKEIIDYIHERE